MNRIDERMEQAASDLQAVTSTVPIPDSPRQQPKPTEGRRIRPVGAMVVAFAAALLVGLPTLLLNPDEDATMGSDVAATQPGSTAVAPESEVESVGGASPVEGATVGLELLAAGDALYTVGVGEVDQILRSLDAGRSWEAVLTADPGDAEGLFAAGSLVLQVVEDDDPARDSVEPGSAVSDAPRALVFDPATGTTTETLLPRPEDPEMTGLPTDGSSDCALAGYQSWVRADGVAVGERLLVVGSHQLVGELDSGGVICDNRAYRHLAWVSADGGVTWEMHDAPAVVAVAWTGYRFVGWSTANEILTSDDGVTWTTAATTPPPAEGLIAVGPPQLASSGERVIGLAEFHGWAAEIPENPTDPEDLREALGMGTDPDTSPAGVLEMIGVDLPLDDNERGIIERYNGSTRPTSAVIAVSEDGGSTWTVESVDEPLTGVAIAGNLYVALATPEPDGPSVLLSSTSGAAWERLAELPVPGEGRTLAATSDSIFVADANSGDLWTISLEG